MTDHEVHVRAAAYAAASWVRARRATWTDPEADPALAFGATTAVEFGMGSGRFGDVTSADQDGEKAPSYLLTRTKALGERTKALAKTFANKWRAIQFGAVLKLSRRAFAVLAVIASAIALAMIGREYGQMALRTKAATKVREAAVMTPPKTPAPAVNPTIGQLHITSSPASARVTIDGKPRGVTPLLVDNLKIGTHSVVLQSTDGTVEETVKIASGDTQELAEAIYPGWLALYSPFDVAISERGRALALDERHQLLLPPGEHTLRIGNFALGYDETRRVVIKPGAVAPLSIAPPKSTMTVTANAPSQVWLDGKLLGDAPVEAVPVDLGTHTVVVRRASGGQRQLPVTVTVKPLELNVEF